MLLEDIFIDTVGQFICGAIANSTGLVQTNRDLGRTHLAEETCRNRRAMKNTSLQSGGAFSVTKACNMAANNEVVELQKAQREINAAQSKYNNAIKRGYLEAVKKSRAI